MGFRWFLDLQENVIMKYLRKKKLNRSREQIGDDSWGQRRDLGSAVQRAWTGGERQRAWAVVLESE